MANIRQQIVTAISQRLVSVGDIKTVTVWRIADLQSSDLPAIIVRDTVDDMPADGVGNGRRDHRLNIEIEIIYSGVASAESVREGISLVLQALGADPTLGGLAYDMVPASASMDIADAAMQHSAAQMVVTVFYRSSLWTI